MDEDDMRFTGAVACALVVLCINQAHAQAGTMSLDVTGNITSFTDAAARTYHLSEADLLAMPVHSITTSTTWTPTRTFQGPSLGDILAKVGAKGSMLMIYALDNYSYAVPVSDVKKYDPVLSYEMDGVRMTIRNFGPLFLMYPRDKYPSELSSPVYDSRFIWQVRRIDVK
ncbi:molybdopterin-dependent oxidoreductase [Paraburkholderia sp. EG286B]|uniref:molybdopterin-dependent oxidoreductase n=1 Tax=Paraburkholderia sp. EG286B TaxID=3237011 RepID=UPI0034D32567